MRDTYHYVVIKGLQKEGWTITHDPLFLRVSKKRTVEIDLGAEKLIGAEKDNTKIAVEIKSFINKSELHDFYKALGQNNFYSLALRKKMPDRILFLAVPSEVYNDFFDDEFIEEVVEEYHLKIIVYNIENETIEQWIN